AHAKVVSPKIEVGQEDEPFLGKALGPYQESPSFIATPMVQDTIFCILGFLESIAQLEVLPTDVQAVAYGEFFQQVVDHANKVEMIHHRNMVEVMTRELPNLAVLVLLYLEIEGMQVE
ncbi:hypothetical protein HAX54_024362, partial [Datura stramonium]|nr:hypothetical protein [Datura stramonium]